MEGGAQRAEDHRLGHRFLTLTGGRFTRHILIYIAGMLAVGPASLVMVAVITRVLNAAQYAEMATLFIFAGYLTVLYNTGSLHGTFMLVYGVSEGEGDEVDSDTTLASAPRRALGTGVVLTLLIVAAGTAVCFELAPLLARLLPTAQGTGASAAHHSSPAALVRWAAASAAAGSLWRLTVNVFRMEHKPGRFALFNATRPLFVLAGALPLVLAGFGIQGALAGTALGTLAAAAVNIAAARRSYALAFSFTDSREILRRGAMVVVPVTCLYLVHNADTLLVAHYASPHEAGIYRVASRFGAAPSYFASAFLMAWAPLEGSVLFRATYNHFGPERARGAILTYYLLISMTLVVALDVVGGGLVLLVGREYRSAAPLIPLIGLGFVCYGLYVVLARVLQVKKRRMLLFGGGALLATALQVYLSSVTIPWLGAPGAPLATLVGLLVSCLLWVGVAKGLMGITLGFDSRPLAGLGIAVACAIGVQGIGLQLWPAGRPFVLAMVFVVYFAVLAALRVVPRGHLRMVPRLARAALRSSAPEREPAAGLERLERQRRELLATVERDAVPTIVLAERLGRPASEVQREYVAALRELLELRPASTELDEGLAVYLTSRESEAQRDHIAGDLIEEGVDAFELMELDRAVHALRALPPEAWTVSSHHHPLHHQPLPERQRRSQRTMLPDLARHLAGLPAAQRRAAIAILRDGHTASQAAAATGVSEPLVAARVVRTLRGLDHLGAGSPRDAAIGMSLFGAPPESRPPEARAVALTYDRIRHYPRRSWRRAGIGASA
jgi:O-antigen/teichoic acid export membrane protein